MIDDTTEQRINLEMTNSTMVSAVTNQRAGKLLRAVWYIRQRFCVILVVNRGTIYAALSPIFDTCLWLHCLSMTCLLTRHKWIRFIVGRCAMPPVFDTRQIIIKITCLKIEPDDTVFIPCRGFEAGDYRRVALADI